jgi:hypothetical protein
MRLVVEREGDLCLCFGNNPWRETARKLTDRVASSEVRSGRRTRMTLIWGGIFSSIVVALTPVPMRVLSPGSPGTDPDSGAVVFETLSGFTRVPTWIILLSWMILVAAVWSRRQLGGDAARWVLSVLATVVAVACLSFAGLGSWMSLTAYEVPQIGEALYQWWLFSSSAFTAAALGVVLSTRPAGGAGLWVVGAMAISFVPPAGLFLVFGIWMQAESVSVSGSLAAAAGIGLVAVTLALFALVSPLWKRAAAGGHPQLLGWMVSGVALFGPVVAGYILYLLVFSALFGGGGISLVVVPFGPLLFSLIALLPMANHRDLGDAPARLVGRVV